MILAGFPTVYQVTLRTASKALCGKVVGQLAGAGRYVSPGEALVAKDDALFIGTCGCDGFVNFSDTEKGWWELRHC